MHAKSIDYYVLHRVKQLIYPSFEIDELSLTRFTFTAKWGKTTVINI